VVENQWTLVQNALELLDNLYGQETVHPQPTLLLLFAQVDRSRLSFEVNSGIHKHLYNNYEYLLRWDYTILSGSLFQILNELADRDEHDVGKLVSILMPRLERIVSSHGAVLATVSSVLVADEKTVILTEDMLTPLNFCLAQANYEKFDEERQLFKKKFGAAIRAEYKYLCDTYDTRRANITKAEDFLATGTPDAAMKKKLNDVIIDETREKDMARQKCINYYALYSYYL
jgi:hypothetical protein